MLRTNLATRPFYNERGVHLVLGVVAVLGLAVLGVWVLQLVDLSRRSTDLTVRAEGAEVESADLSARTTEIQRAVSAQALEEVAAAAREANTLIDQRVFSWTNFFNRIETTLPADVMVTEVRPDLSPGLVEVTMGVVGRGLEDITEFIGALEDSGAFAEVLPRQEELTEDGMYRAVLRGRYLEALPGEFVAPEDELPGAADNQDAAEPDESLDESDPDDGGEPDDTEPDEAGTEADVEPELDQPGVAAGGDRP
jgi:hypothetical protein